MHLSANANALCFSQIKWTKGYNCPDAPGQEIVGLLQSSIDALHLPVHVNALVNDTVGALLAHGYQAHGAVLGAIFGTGTNGAYVENVARIPKMKPACAHGEETMIINTEWGGFDDEVSLARSWLTVMMLMSSVVALSQRAALAITLFDNAVDRTAIRPRHHAFEKMISGMCELMLLKLLRLSVLS